MSECKFGFRRDYSSLVPSWLNTQICSNPSPTVEKSRKKQQICKNIFFFKLECNEYLNSNF